MKAEYTRIQKEVEALDTTDTQLSEKLACEENYLEAAGMALLDVLSLHKESETLLQLFDNVRSHILALRTLHADTWDSLVIHLLVNKLDSMTKREWRANFQQKGRDNASFETFINFLKERCTILRTDLIEKPKGHRIQAAEVKAYHLKNKPIEYVHYKNTSRNEWNLSNPSLIQRILFPAYGIFSVESGNTMVEWTGMADKRFRPLAHIETRRQLGDLRKKESDTRLSQPGKNAVMDSIINFY
ncbi:hypothetical protein KM043_014441 [Ampulex compressa]|nr:hypothetical protein KM043_014441 [Ampulex compressa]